MPNGTNIVIIAYGSAGILVGLMMYAMVRVQRTIDAQESTPSQPTSRPMPPQQPKIAPLQPAPMIARPTTPVVNNAPPLPVQTFGLVGVLQKLSQAVHVLIVGPTNAGKSTAANGLLVDRVKAKESIIILDPHAAPNDWHSIKTVGFGRDYESIESTMTALLDEMTRRYELRSKDMDYKAEPMTIFIDEWPAIQSHCQKIAPQFMCEMAQEGRKVGMRLVILTQSDRVESLGLSGKGDVRDNFTALLLGDKAVEKCPDATGKARPAAMQHLGVFRVVDLFGMDIFAQTKLDTVNLWQTKEEQTHDL